MQHYSPPLTRQKARVLYIAQSVASTNGTRCQHQQFSQSGSSSGSGSGSSSSVGARQAEPTNPSGGSRARDPRSDRAERAARRARGGEELNSVGQKPKSVANVGNIGARCRKGCTRGGVAVQHPHSSSNAGGVRREETAAAAATLTGADSEVAPPSQQQQQLAVSSPAPSPPCPLEELKPSVLNAKALHASSSMSSGPGGGGGDGMESGATPGGVVGVVGMVSGDGAVGSSRKFPAGKDEGAVHGVGSDMGEGKKGRKDGDCARDVAVVMKDGVGNGEGGGTLPNPPSRSGQGAPASSSARAQTCDAVTDRNSLAEVAPPRASPQEELEFMGGAARGNSVQLALSDRNGGVTPEASPHVLAGDSPGGDRGGRRGLTNVADEGTGARLKGKSVEAKGSTGVSPMQKRNRRELKLSEEESAMAGAPQGPVYQVTVLETEEFEASLNAEEEMKAVLAAAQGGGDWADLYSAVDSTRRVCIFHRDVLAREGNLQGAVRLLVAGVGNLRSTTVRNALLGVSDIFSFLGHDMARVDIRQIVAGTMQRLAGEKRFICQTAAQAMEMVTRKGPGVEVLHSILPAVDDRNAEISSKAAVYSDQCLAALGVGSNPGSGLPEGFETQRLVAGMGKALRGKLADGRSGARRALLRVRKAMGPGAFESFISEHLDKGDAAGVISTLATCSSQATAGASSLATGRGGRGAPAARAAAGGRDFASRRSQTSGFRAGRGGDRPGKGIGASGARSSIREQMMARKRQLEEDKMAVARQEERGGDPDRQGEGEGSPDGFRVSAGAGAGGRERDHRDGERRASAGSFLIVS